MTFVVVSSNASLNNSPWNLFVLPCISSMMVLSAAKVYSLSRRVSAPNCFHCGSKMQSFGCRPTLPITILALQISESSLQTFALCFGTFTSLERSTASPRLLSQKRKTSFQTMIEHLPYSLLNRKDVDLQPLHRPLPKFSLSRILSILSSDSSNIVQYHTCSPVLSLSIPACVSYSSTKLLKPPLFIYIFMSVFFFSVCSLSDCNSSELTHTYLMCLAHPICETVLLSFETLVTSIS